MPDASPRVEALLTAEAPSKEFPLGAVPASPAAAEVVLLRIANPSGEAFSVRVSLAQPGPDGSERVADVGSFTPYPADRTGTHLLSVPEPAVELLKSRDAGTKVRVFLEPVAPGRPLPAPLEVVIAEPVWRGAP